MFTDRLEGYDDRSTSSDEDRVRPFVHYEESSEFTNFIPARLVDGLVVIN